MITFKDSFIFLGSAVLLVFSFASDLRGVEKGEGLTYRLTPDTIAPGERATLELRLPKSIGSKFSAERSGLEPVVNDAWVTGNQAYRILNRQFKNEKNEYVWTYEVTGYKSGEFSIPPVEVQWGPFSFSSERAALNVSSTRPADDNALREEFGKVGGPLDWRRWSKWIFLSVLAGTGFAFAYAFFPKVKRRRRPPAPSARVEPREDDDVWFRRRLAELKLAIETHDPDDAASVDDVTQVLREYFERRLNSPVRMWTTAEVRNKILGDAGVSRMIPIFERCDTFKFTPGRRHSARELALYALGEAENLLSPNP